MAQTNDKPNKTCDRLTIKLNRLTTDLNNEGNMDADVSIRWLRSRSIAVSTLGISNTGQMTTVETTFPQSITTQVG